MPTQVFNKKVGEHYGVILKETPSSGYIWTFEPQQGVSIESMLIDDEQADGELAIGAEHKRVFNIAAREPGTYNITFTLQRPWEDKPPLETHELEISFE